MNCSRQDLVFTDYHWNEEAVEDRLSHDAHFNRRDGHHMLEVLNACSSSWQQEKTHNFFGNLEKVIRQLVPSRMKTVREVRSWIESHRPRL